MVWIYAFSNWQWYANRSRRVITLNSNFVKFRLKSWPYLASCTCSRIGHVWQVKIIVFGFGIIPVKTYMARKPAVDPIVCHRTDTNCLSFVEERLRHNQPVVVCCLIISKSCKPCFGQTNSAANFTKMFRLRSVFSQHQVQFSMYPFKMECSILFSLSDLQLLSVSIFQTEHYPPFFPSI